MRLGHWLAGVSARWLTGTQGAAGRRPASRQRPRSQYLPVHFEALESRTLLNANFPEFVDPNPSPGNLFGLTVVPLSTGNVVITSPFDDAGGTDAGAVYLFNGATGALISTLTGSQDYDYVGSGVTALTNGNYVVISNVWDNGTATDAGAVTWGSGISGVSGTVSDSNSLVGGTAGDNVGIGGVIPLTNGNYVVSSPFWDNGTAYDAGAATWGSGTSGVSGTVSESNSLVGSTAEDYVGSTDYRGFGYVIPLTNGNYVVSSYLWDNGTATDAGAVTWGSGTSGVTGTVSDSNSLVGSTAGDNLGIHYGGARVTPLTNGNYVVSSPFWDNGTAYDAGAVTWGSGTSGVTGTVSDSNSLVGNSAEDNVGLGGVTALTNGNYVVGSYNWDNGTATDAGAVTWGSGTSGVSGTVSDSNSLVGSTGSDAVGSGGVTPLTNGNYVVSSPWWGNGAEFFVGAVTWGSGTSGVSGTVSESNSLVGSIAYDNVSIHGVTALTNGNYVVSSSLWNNGTATDAGAVTWGSGTSGVSGAVSASNSLVGSTVGDAVGGGGVTPLTNGNYVVNSYLWNNGPATNAGAVTWGSGTSGVTGTVSDSNSLVGSTAGDIVGGGGVTLLTNDNYVITSNSWDNGTATDAGAVTWGSGTSGVSGAVSDSNSLVGSTAEDNLGIGYNGVTPLTNGNYVVRSYLWDNGTAYDAGAVTWGSGTSGVSGTVSDSNSLVGSTARDFVGLGGVTALPYGNYVVNSYAWDNGTAYDAGAVTWGSGTSGVSGTVSESNSLVGSTANDQVGNGGVTPLTNGNYVVRSSLWNNGTATDAGAVTWGSGTSGVSGIVSESNSIVGTTSYTGLQFGVVIDDVNQTFFASFVSEDNGRVRVGSQGPGANTPPTALVLSAATVAENQPSGTTVGTFIPTDPNTSDTFTYALVAGTGDTHNGSFSIVGNTLRTAASFDYETQSSYAIRVRVTDAGGLTFEQTFTISMTNINPSIPVDNAPATANQVVEGAMNGTPVGITAQATDPNGPAVTYSLTDSAGGRFTIHPTTGVVTVANGALLNHESATSHSITVQASDGAAGTPGTSSQTFTIAILNANPSPPIDNAAATANEVVKGAANGTTVGITARSIDVNGATITYSLTDNAGGRFAIGTTSGIVTVANSALLSADTVSSHSITVQASDGFGGTATSTFSITLLSLTSGLNDINATANEVAEGAYRGTLAGLTVRTSAVGMGSVSYSLTDNAGGRFFIHPTTGVVMVADQTLFNYESAPSHTIIARASYQNGSHDTQSFTIDVRNIGPTVPIDFDTSGVNQVTEGATDGTPVRITARSTDINGALLAYSLIDDAGGRFAINSSTGVVSVANGSLLDYETATTHTIVVAVSDGFLSASRTFTIAVRNVAPFATGDSDGRDNQVTEGDVAGTEVGITASAADVNGGTITYSLSSSAGGRFAIDPTTGIVSVANQNQINYETTKNYTIVVKASDGNKASYQPFTINVMNAAPGDLVDISSGLNQVHEGAPTGKTVGLTVNAVDPNGGTVIYTLLDNAGGRFAISRTAGLVTVLNGSLLDYETSTSHTITVQATDPYGASTTADFTIDILNVNPTTPTDINFVINRVNAAAIAGTQVGITARSFDPNTTPIVFTLTGGLDQFEIDSATGVVTVGSSGLISVSTLTNYIVTITASDGTVGTASRTFTITVIPAPVPVPPAPGPLTPQILASLDAAFASENGTWLT